MISLYRVLVLVLFLYSFFFFFKQKTAYEMRISDWSSDVCSSDLEDDSVLKIGQNLKYDITVLRRHGIEIAPYDDTIVMSFDLDAGQSLAGHGMDEAAKTHLNHSCISFKDVAGTGKKQISFAEVPLDRATEYAAEDADVTLRPWQLSNGREHV